MDAGRGDELIRLTIDGPSGHGVVVLYKDTPLQVLK